MSSLQSIVILGAQLRSSDVDGIKLFNKDNQAAKHFSFILMFCGLVILIIDISMYT